MSTTTVIVDNMPYAKARLLTDLNTNKRFLVYETGPAVVVLLYKLKSKGEINLLFIKETRDTIDSNEVPTVVKTIGGFIRERLCDMEAKRRVETIIHLIEKETGLKLPEVGSLKIRTIGDHPDFEIAKFPIEEITVFVSGELPPANPPLGTELIWMDLKAAGRFAIEGKFGDAAAEVAVMRFCLMEPLGYFTA